MTTRPELSPMQARTFEAIRAFVREHGYAPTVRELGAILDRQNNGILEHVRRLEAKGYLRRLANSSRAMVIVDSDAPPVPCPTTPEDARRAARGTNDPAARIAELGAELEAAARRIERLVVLATKLGASEGQITQAHGDRLTVREIQDAHVVRPVLP